MKNTSGLEAFVSAWNREAERTLQLLESLPRDQYDFRPITPLILEKEPAMFRFLSMIVAIASLGFTMSAGAAWAGESPAKALDSRFLKAFNANDLEAIVACYADDAVIYPPDTFMAKGKEAIRGSFREFLNQFKISNATISDATYLDMGDRSVGWGIVEFTMTPSAGGEAMPKKGRFTSVSEKRNGKWVFISDHASLPMGPSTP